MHPWQTCVYISEQHKLRYMATTTARPPGTGKALRLYTRANKLACHSFPVDSQRFLSQRQRTLSFPGRQAAWALYMHRFPCHLRPSPTRARQRQVQADAKNTSWMRNLELSRPPSFESVADKHAQPLPQRKTWSLVSCPLPWRKTLCLPAKSLHYTNTATTVQNKLWHDMWRNARSPQRIVSQQRPSPAREKEAVDGSCVS